MTTLVLQPKSMTRATEWSEQVEEAYRFQLAGYRDANEYGSFHGKNVSLTVCMQHKIAKSLILVFL